MFSCFDTIPACDGQTDILRQHRPRYTQHRAVIIKSNMAAAAVWNLLHMETLRCTMV